MEDEDKGCCEICKKWVYWSDLRDEHYIDGNGNLCEEIHCSPCHNERLHSNNTDKKE